MKKLIYILGIAAAVAACTVEEMDQPVIESGYRASFETKDTKDTKVYVDPGLNMHWNSGDKIGLFEAGTLLQQYVFDGATGDTEGSFSKKSGSAGGSSLDAVYAVYPYSDALEINTNGDISLSLPAVQKYAVNSFGLGANTCIAVTTNPKDKNLVFKNLCGYVIVNLYGDGKVSKVTLKGNNGEVLAGNAIVWTSMAASAITSLDGAKEIILECGDQGVELGSSADKATAFWFVVPPVTFSKGLTVEVLKSDGTSFTKTTTTSRTVDRNKVYRMTASETQDPSFGEVRSLKYTASSQLDAGYDIKIQSDGTVQTIENFSKYEVGQPFCGSVIAEHKFDYTAKQGEIVFTGPITEIEDGAFYNCTLLSGDILIPNGISKVGAYAFYKCKNLNGFKAENIYEIGKYALAEMSGLTSFSFGPNLTVIPEGLMQHSFQSSTGGSFTLGNKNVIIEDFAFDGCHLEGILTIPDSVEKIGKAAFRDCKFDGDLTLGANLKIIDDAAFYNVPLNGLVLNDKIESIGSGAFYGCSIYEELTLPPSLKYLGDIAFYDCNIHGSLTIPADLMYLGYGAFMNTYINELVFQDGVTEVPSLFACQCYYLKSITLPDSIHSIGEYAFSSCDDINCELHLPQSLEYIGDYAFADCIEMTGSLIFPEGVKYIGKRAFYCCYGLDGVLALNAGLETVGESAFQTCYNLLGAIIIPDSTTSLGSSAFRDCSGLSGSLKIGNGILDIPDYAFYGCSKLAGTVIIGKNVKTIGDFAFHNCSSLTHSLSIPDSVTSIGTYAFYGCSSLENTIRLSKNLTLIDNKAFSKCSLITEVYCPAEVPPTIYSTDVFEYSNNLKVIYVPSASVEAYTSHRYWKSYQSLITGHDFSGQ